MFSMPIRKELGKRMEQAMIDSLLSKIRINSQGASLLLKLGEKENTSTLLWMAD
jgi:hypothetical protein